MTTLVRFNTQFYGAEGLYSGGDVAGFADAVATQLIAAGIAVEYDAGAGLGVPTTSPFRGIGASETPAQYATAGGTLGDQVPSAAIQGFIGETTITDGYATADSEPWA